jgi:tetratricopeptide (TPR) repeat protein
VGELAVHHAAAGDSEHAYRYYRQAAQVALARYALAHAEALLDAALAHAPDDPEVRIELLQEQNTVFNSSLQFGRWRQNLHKQQALSASLTPSNLRLRLEIALSCSRYFATIGDGGEAVAAARAAIDLAQAMQDQSTLAQVYQALGEGYWLQAQMSAASHAFGQSAQYAGEAGDHVVELNTLALQAQTGMFSGMPAEQIFDLLTRAFAMAEATGNKQQLANLYHKFAYWWLVLGMGHFDRIEGNYRRGLALAREIGDRGREEMILSHLGLLFTGQGDYRRALDAIDASLSIGQGDPPYWHYWVVRHYRGAVMMQVGCLDSARTELSNASEQLRQLGHRHVEVRARSDLGLLYHLAGEHQQAQAELAHVLSLIEGHGDLRFEAQVSTRLGYVLAASGQADRARRMYEHGYTLHREMGQHYYALNALAGLARLAELQGDEITAFAHGRTIWETIAGKPTDATIETARTLRTCYSIFRQHGDPQAAEILRTASAQLHRRAGTIAEPEHVEQFWQLADHRFFQEATVENARI